MGLLVLILGLIVFLGSPRLRDVPRRRVQPMIARLGQNGYRALFCAGRHRSGWR